ncbi:MULTISPECIES: tautomerase family protein [unclassified Caulobacter]|uniref:tautomerase family protein n=1 Tax=unclassified Caulobacter TaxID=2648921 RepID=UPI0018EE8FCD|nr:MULTISPECIES: tautomerase family protein [unclassified Caulobacter]
MPHVNIKYFPRDLTPEARQTLVEGLLDLITKTFDVSETTVSIALEPVTPETWRDRVVVPELLDRAGLLVRRPGYDFA